MNITDLLSQEENDWLDFKQSWYHSNFDLIKDILCMSNSLSDKKERYIVIGVTDKDHKIIGISDGAGKWTSENITQLLLAYMTVIPEIVLIHVKVEGKKIDVLKIIPKRQDLPYVLDRKRYEEKIYNTQILFQNVVYARNNSRNTPSDRGADKIILEQLICRKKGLDLSPIERFNYYVRDIDSWVCPKNDEESILYCNKAEAADLQIFVKENRSFSLCSGEDIRTYNDFLTISGLNDTVWNWKKYTTSCSIEEGFSFYSVTVKLQSTTIKQFNIVGLDLKHEPFPGFNSFFVPEFGWDCHYSKGDIINLPEYQVCRLMCKVHNENRENDEILDYLNWEYLGDSSAFWDKYSYRRMEVRKNS